MFLCSFYVSAFLFCLLKLLECVSKSSHVVPSGLLFLLSIAFFGYLPSCGSICVLGLLFFCVCENDLGFGRSCTEAGRSTHIIYDQDSIPLFYGTVSLSL